MSVEGRSRFRRELATAAHPRSLRELAASGVSKGQLRGRGWRRSSHGFYVPVGYPITPVQRILDAVPLVPSGGALSGWAAAFAAGVDRLDGVDPGSMEQQPIPVCLGRDIGWRKRSGFLATKEPLDLEDVTFVAGLPVTTLIRAAFDGARLADTLEEAVAFLDACAHEGNLSIPEIRRYIADRSGWRGIKMARRAVALAQTAARSSWESRLRVHLLIDLALPNLRVNVPVFCLDGALLGIPDLFLEDAGVMVEYDGADHLRRAQHHDDRRREEAFEAAGVIVTRADVLDLRPAGRAALDRRILDAVVRGRARDRRRDRWTLTPPDWWLTEVESTPRLSEEEQELIHAALERHRTLS